MDLQFAILVLSEHCHGTVMDDSEAHGEADASSSAFVYNAHHMSYADLLDLPTGEASVLVRDRA